MTKRLLFGASAAVVGVWIAVGLSAAPAGSRPGLSSTDSLTTIREVHHFDSLESLVATADAVALIRVKDLSETSRDDPDGGLGRTITITAEVEEILSGSLPDGSIKLVFDDAYSESALRGTHHDWTMVGRTVPIGLHLRSDVAAYRPLNQQSVFIVADDSTVSAVWGDAFTSTLEGRTVAEMREAIVMAKREIQEGSVTPQPDRPLASPGS